jgi:dTMP kinase
MRGRFFVLEGVDGAGKTGALQYVNDALSADGYVTLPTREPGGTEEGQALRQLLLVEGPLDWEPVAELLLVTAARVQHVNRVIRPALKKGAIVLCDRFVGSTLAFQGAGRGIPSETILGLHRSAIDDLWPDLTVLLDIDPEKSLVRSRNRLQASASKEIKFENMDSAFHRRVWKSFRHQARQKPELYKIIDADQPQKAVQDAVLSVLQNYLKACPPEELARSSRGA